MGNCDCTANIADDQDFDMNFGQNWNGVYELHHCHKDHKKNQHMTYHDKFMRECFANMYLMTFNKFEYIISQVKPADSLDNKSINSLKLINESSSNVSSDEFLH